MSQGSNASGNLLFGLLALQTGLVDQAALVSAFHAWTRDKSGTLADHLVALGHLNAPQRAVIEALAALHLDRHGDAERSLASLSAGGSTIEGLAQVRDPDLDASLAHLNPSSTRAGDDPDRTATYSFATAPSDGQRFRALRPHARGALGAVFVAMDDELHREVALKRILDQHADDPASRARFVLEAEITGGLEHPGIVPVYGLGTYRDGRPYYAMRFIRGDSLKEAIGRFHAAEGLKQDKGRRSLELYKLLRRFLDVCNAIDYAHSRGVLHRDIKPGNVIVGRYGETLVVDWGLAKATGRSDPSSGEQTLRPSSPTGSAETLPGSALGTPAFMSPEQADGALARLGPWSDVYSLGATLYYLLTGKPPVEGDVVEVLRAVQRGEFPPPRRHDATIDPALEAVCLRAMAHRPEDRYASPKELAEDLERWMADEPVSAWREPWTRRARRWGRRHRSLVIGTAAALLAGVIGLSAVLAVQASANASLSASLLRETKANDDLAAANAELTRAESAVQARYDLAVDAIKTFHTGVSEDFLLKQDQFKELRNQLLNSAAEFYRKLGALIGQETDVTSRQTLQRANFELAELIAKVGHGKEALNMHRSALLARRALAAEPGADPATKADVGRSLIAIGSLLSTGELGKALESLEEARSVLGPLGDSGPDREIIRGLIARSHWRTGVLLNRKGEHLGALPAFERGIEIAQELVAVHPDSLEDQLTLSWCYNSIGILHNQGGDAEKALEAFGESRGIKQQIVAQHHDVAEYRRDLAISHMNIGIVLFHAGRSEEALSEHEAALALRQTVADAYPALAVVQIDLANGLNEIGDVLRVLGRTDQARESYKHALRILDEFANERWYVDSESMRLQGLKGFGATLLDAGQTAEAVASWRQAVKLGDSLRSDYNETLYYLAGCHARLGGVAGAPGSGLPAAEGPVELGRAMDTLRKAVVSGYKSSDWMRRDPDLDPLRSRPDFQLLMMDLAMPDDPFAP